MRHIRIFILGIAVSSAAAAQDVDCVGDHHEDCPVLVKHEARVSKPGCDQSHFSHGEAHSLFKGVLGWQDGSHFRPIADARVVRECLSEGRKVVRSCPMSFTL